MLLHVQIARLICSSKPNNTGWITPSCKTNILSRIEFIFYTVDFAFLVLFFIEICIKFFGLGTCDCRRLLAFV